MSLIKPIECKKDIYYNRLMVSLDRKCYDTNLPSITIREAKKLVDESNWKYNRMKVKIKRNVDNLYKPQVVSDTGSHLDSNALEILKLLKLKRKLGTGSVIRISGPNTILSIIYDINLERFNYPINKVEDYLILNFHKLTINLQVLNLNSGTQIYLDSGSLRDYAYAEHIHKYFNRLNSLIMSKYKMSNIIEDFNMFKSGILTKDNKYFIYEFLTTKYFIGDGLVKPLIENVLNSKLYTNDEKEKMIMYNGNYLDLLCITTRNRLLPQYKTNLEKILNICSEASKSIILNDIKDMKIV